MLSFHFEAEQIVVSSTPRIITLEEGTQVLLSVSHRLCDPGQVTSPLWASIPSYAQMWGLGLRTSSVPSS